MLKISNDCKVIVLLLIAVLLPAVNSTNGGEYSYQNNDNAYIIEDDLSQSKKSDYGTLTGDVQNWAAIIQNYIIQVLF